MTRRRRLLSGAMVLLITGCGTTVSGAGQQPGADGGSVGAVGLGRGTAHAASRTTAGPGSSRQGAAVSPAAGSSPAGRVVTRSEAGGSASVVRTGPRVTAGTIFFGATYTVDQGNANAALGAGGVDSGDARRYYDTVVRDINSRGGVLGRRLSPVYFEDSSTTTQTAAQLQQAACDHWTKDHKVFAVLGAPMGGEVIRACTRKAGVLDLWTGVSTAIGPTFRAYPNYFEVSSINLDRAGAVTAAGLARTDYYGRTPKVGVVTWDDPLYRHSVDHGWKAGLKGAGYSAAQVAYVTVPQSANGLSDSSASVSNAVLRFRAAGITHVMIGDGPAGVFDGTGLTLLWIRAAGSQRYYPRYGFNTANSPVSGYDAGLWTADDIRGARAVSWGDGSDYGDEGIQRNPARVRCFGLMDTAGVPLDNDQAKQTALNACDTLWFLRAALTGGGQATVEAAIRGANGLGTSHSSPQAYATLFSASRHDGTSAVRLAAFNGAWTWASRPFSTG
jgi:hypothetical protein